MKQLIKVRTTKIISAVLGIALIFTMLPAQASAKGTPKLTASKEKASAGEEIVVKLTAEDNPGVMAMVLSIDYDSTRLKCLGIEDGGFTGWTFGNDKAVWVGSSDNDYNGVILKLRFEVLDSAKSGFAEVKVLYDSGDICNYDERPVAFNTVNGGVDVSGSEQKASDGDANSPDTAATENIKTEGNSVKETEDNSVKETWKIKTDSDDKTNPEKADNTLQTANNDENDGNEEAENDSIAPESTEEVGGKTTAKPFAMAGAALILIAVLVIILKKKDRK